MQSQENPRTSVSRRVSGANRGISQSASSIAKQGPSSLPSPVMGEGERPESTSPLPSGSAPGFGPSRERGRIGARESGTSSPLGERIEVRGCGDPVAGLTGESTCVYLHHNA